MFKYRLLFFIISLLTFIGIIYPLVNNVSIYLDDDIDFIEITNHKDSTYYNIKSGDDYYLCSEHVLEDIKRIKTRYKKDDWDFIGVYGDSDTIMNIYIRVTKRNLFIILELGMM